MIKRKVFEPSGTCAWCNVKFERRRECPWQLFCCRRCRGRWHRVRKWNEEKNHKPERRKAAGYKEIAGKVLAELPDTEPPLDILNELRKKPGR
jgi:hypothetical protein